MFVNRIASLMKSGSRLVNLSSSGHRFSDVDLEDPNFEHTPYHRIRRLRPLEDRQYLFAVEFDRRHKGRGVRATAVHPGGIQTELGRYMTPEVQQAADRRSTPAKPAGAPAFSWKTIPQGAATRAGPAWSRRPTWWAAAICEDCHVAEVVETRIPRRRARYALDPEHAKALWAKSEEMVGERF